jgi:hypothetical protein
MSTRPEGARAPLFHLPARPSVEQLKRQARDLQQAVLAGEPGALTLLEHAGITPGPKLGRSDALHAVARAYGWSTWPALKAHVETVTRFAREPHRPGPDRDEADRLLRLGCLAYGGDDSRRIDEARALLAARPELARASVFTLAATADAAGLEALLARDAALARAQGGPHRWEPLLYLTYSRLGAGSPIQACRVLLDAGADPNAGFLWEGHAPPFTALTGAFGGGEDARNQPPHHAALEVARVLLEAGADPNDGQALYNRQFAAEDDHLELLLAFGLGRGAGGPWRARLGAAQASPQQLLEDQLLVAAADDRPARMALLLRHGVDPNGLGTRHPAHRGRGALELARDHGNVRVEELLRAAGATAPVESPAEALMAAAMRGDDAAVAQADPALAAEAVGRDPGRVIAAAASGRGDAVRLLVRLGFDPSFRRRTTALHEAAWRGDRAMVDLLLALGADPTVPDTEFGATPAGWADHNGHPDLAAHLRARGG